MANNAVTALAVHPVKSDYVLIGYDRGQIILYDCTDTSKCLKTVKHHPQGTPITNLAFCDWIKPKGKQ